MARTVGPRLGLYDITGSLGLGGMGEVYRARDTRLKREVALKVLPESFATDPDRLARFQREAEVLASLNHPNIAGIYGLVEADSSDGSGQVITRALVMELVEGETLAERIARGPTSVDEALLIAKQIADALEAAHEQAIIHRDLKPANIKVRSDGTVKVLDFGLAKLADASGVGGADFTPPGTMSPTITSPAMTGMGVLLGTAAYMSPEQAKGKPADKRSDIWAFGCVLYEMLSGKRAFDGNEVADILASVLKSPVNFDVLPADTPSAVRRVLRRCFEKDRARRLADIADARLELQEALEAHESDRDRPLARSARRGTWRSAAVAIAALAVVILAGAAVSLVRRTVPAPVSRTTMALPRAAAYSDSGADRNLTITSDGRQVVYIGNNATQLFVRPLDSLDSTPIASGAQRAPFVSPDNQWVGFVDSGDRLKKVAITGGPVTTIAQLDGAPRGATWAPDDTIVLATTNLSTGLMRVAAAGGDPEVLTRPDASAGEADHLWPDMLPNHRAVLFTITAQSGGLDAAEIAALDLRSGNKKVLVRGGTHAAYTSSGHLVYATNGMLRAVAFDQDRLEVHGPAVPVVPRVAININGASDFAVAADGTLVYVDAPTATSNAPRTLVWVDRSGKEEPVGAPPRPYTYPRISPDGSRLAVAIADQEGDVWMWDLRRATLTRLTFDPGLDSYPVWTRDGRRVVHSSARESTAQNLWWRVADGSGTPERLTSSQNTQQPSGLTPDGKQIVFWETTHTGRDLFAVSLDGTRHVTPILATPFDEHNGVVSPDGRWIAYESDSSGRFEIYVRPFPDTASGQWQISSAGGTRPLWSKDGKELFFLGGDGALMRVVVSAADRSWNAGTPLKVLEPLYFVGANNIGRTYDMSADATRFLMIKPAGGEAGGSPQIIVVQHWTDELKRLVPVP